MRNLALLSAIAALLIAPGCAVTNAALDDDDGRTVARSINDINAARTIRARMTRAHGFKLGGVDVEVREGTALLSGRVPRPEDRIEAERIAWSAPRVDRIGNEIVIGDKQGLIRNTKDGVLEKTVRTRLIASGDVAARELNVETHEGRVFMLGLVDSLEERDRATQIAATTRGVKEVISYIEVRGEAAPEVGAYAAAPLPYPSSPYTGSPYAATPADGRTPAPSFELPEETVRAAPIVPPALPMAPPNTAPFYRDPVTGERVEMPPGTEVVPGAGGDMIDIPEDAGQGAPFYIDPDSGMRIPVRYDSPL